MDTRHLTADQLLKLLATLERIEKLDMSEVEAELSSPQRRVLLDLQTKKVLERKIKQRKPGRPKSHWRTKKMKLKARKARYYENTVKPRRLKAYEEYVKQGDWYEVCVEAWSKRKSNKIKITKDEWELNVKIPEGRVPVVRRYDTKAPWELANIEVQDNESKAVFFSGLDWKLREIGATVKPSIEELE